MTLRRNLPAWVILAVLLLGAASASPQFRKKKEDDTVRNLRGQVLNALDEPLEKAVVYLKNTRSLQVRTFITRDDGMYQFGSLSTNIDYEVRAEMEGLGASNTRVLSSFDNRKEATLNLKIEKKQ